MHIVYHNSILEIFKQNITKQNTTKQTNKKQKQRIFRQAICHFTHHLHNDQLMKAWLTLLYNYRPQTDFLSIVHNYFNNEVNFIIMQFK